MPLAIPSRAYGTELHSFGTATAQDNQTTTATATSTERGSPFSDNVVLQRDKHRH